MVGICEHVSRAKQVLHWTHLRSCKERCRVWVSQTVVQVAEQRVVKDGSQWHVSCSTVGRLQVDSGNEEHQFGRHGGGWPRHLVRAQDFGNLITWQSNSLRQPVWVLPTHHDSFQHLRQSLWSVWNYLVILRLKFQLPKETCSFDLMFVKCTSKLTCLRV